LILAQEGQARRYFGSITASESRNLRPQGIARRPDEDRLDQAVVRDHDPGLELVLVVVLEHDAASGIAADHLLLRAQHFFALGEALHHGLQQDLPIVGLLLVLVAVDRQERHVPIRRDRAVGGIAGFRLLRFELRLARHLDAETDAGGSVLLPGLRPSCGRDQRHESECDRRESRTHV